MSIRMYLDDLPKGHAAAIRVEDGHAVIIVDRGCVQRARDRGDPGYGARLVNDMFRALESHGGHVPLHAAS